MTEAEFNKELKTLYGGYVFYGDEDYLKFSYIKQVRKNVLDGMFDEFNHIVIYGEDYTPATLMNAISTLPMMSEKKLVELLGVDFNAFKKDDISALECVLESMKENAQHTVLVIRADSDLFNAGRLPKAPSEIYKMMAKHLTMVQFDFPSNIRLKGWILKHFEKSNIKFDEGLCQRLVDICGHDMWALSNEIDKLCSYAQMSNLSYITAENIDYICCKTVEYDDFQLTNVILEKNKALIFETLRRQKVNHEKPSAILSSIIRLFLEIYLVYEQSASGLSKAQISSALGIHEFKVGKYLTFIKGVNPKKLKRAVELCAQADVESKTYSNLTDYLAVERLISALCVLFCG